MFNLFNRQPRAWRTPGGQVYTLFDDIVQQHNVLIAGEVGSGKSCVMNGLIYNLLHQGPGKVQFIFIDPKWSEFGDYENLPHTIKYACSNPEIVEALNIARSIIEKRKAELKAQHKRQYEGANVYIMVDEMAHVMLTMKKTARPIFQEIMQIGRALNVHVIAGTQCPLATVIPTEIKVNFTATIGLRTATKQQSRNIIGQAGCELFPEPKTTGKAYGYYMRGGIMELYDLPRYTEKQYADILHWWTSSQCIA